MKIHLMKIHLRMEMETTIMTQMTDQTETGTETAGVPMEITMEIPLVAVHYLSK
jgi:hypothetical protein